MTCLYTHTHTHLGGKRPSCIRMNYIYAHIFCICTHKYTYRPDYITVVISKNITVQHQSMPVSCCTFNTNVHSIVGVEFPQKEPVGDQGYFLDLWLLLEQQVKVIARKTFGNTKRYLMGLLSKMTRKLQLAQDTVAS